MDPDLKLHEDVIKGGYPNIWGARIPIETKWDLDLFSRLLENYEDREVVQWMRYGWPSGRLPSLGNTGTSNKNHKGATDHPEALRKYIKKEAAQGAVMGPYDKIPFTSKVGISPLSTRPKRESTE